MAKRGGFLAKPPVGVLAVTSTRRVVVLEAVAKRNKAAGNEAPLPHLARTQAGLAAAEVMAEDEKAEALAVLLAPGVVPSGGLAHVPCLSGGGLAIGHIFPQAI